MRQKWMLLLLGIYNWESTQQSCPLGWQSTSFLCCVPDLCQSFLLSILSDTVVGKVCRKASVGLTPWVLTIQISTLQTVILSQVTNQISSTCQPQLKIKTHTGCGSEACEQDSQIVKDQISKLKLHFIICLPSVSNDGEKEKAIQAIWTPQLAS